MKLNATLSSNQLKNILSLVLLCSLFMFPGRLLAQPLTGTKTVCTSGCDYTTLSSAGGLFEAINTNGLGGNLTVTINSDLTETGNVALNNITIGSAFTITIKPDAAILRTISGSTINATAPIGLIKLIGADNVTIDGNYLGSGKFLLFRNSNAVTSGSSTTPVFNIDNTATSDVITNCIIESNASNGARPPVLVNSTGTNSVTISNCDIRNSTGGATGNPNTGIRSSGTSNTVQILNNNIYNFTQYGINLASAATGCNITGNSLYSTVAVGTAVTCMNIIGGDGHTIQGNYIGGSAPLCGGTPWITSADVNFTGMLVNNSFTTPTSIQNNTIQNISLTNTNFPYNSSCILMDLGVGSYNVGTVTGNTLGHATTPNSIQVSTDGALGTIGIRSNGASGTVNLTNNTIANIKTTGTLATMTLRGIENKGANTVNITGNDIHSLQNLNSTSETVTGIYVSGNGTTTITGNTISDLEATDATVSTTLNGILLNTPTSTSILRNRIYNLRSLSPGGNLLGVNITGGIASLANNQISITNSTNTNSLAIKGILSAGTSAATLYYNSVYLGGTAASGSANSYAYHRSGSGTSLLKNNLLFNGRTGGTGYHYALGNTNGAPATGWGANASNYNLLVSSNASYLGEWGTGANKDFTNWIASSGGDGNSWSTTSGALSVSNLFTNLTTGNLDILIGNPEAWYVNGRGVQVIGQTADYGNVTAGRSTLVTTGAPDIGSDEMVPTSTPPAPTVTGTLAVGNTQTFTFAGRTLGTIQWTAGTALPSAITWQYRPGTNPPNNLNNHYSNAYWTISATGGTTYTYTLALYYDPATLGTAVENNLAISKKPEASTAWAYLPGSVVNSTAKTVTIAGLTSFSHFTLTDNISPLPIKLESFKAKAATTSVNLEWSVASENNLDNYEIERSENNVAFTTIAKISAKGNNGTYFYADLNAIRGVNYYRLRMNESSGDFVYSNTVLAILQQDRGSVSIYPNPADNVLNVSVTTPISGKGNITIVDMTGRIIHNATLYGSAMAIDTKTLAKGTYFLKYDNGAQKETVKFIKL